MPPFIAITAVSGKGKRLAVPASPAAAASRTSEGVREQRAVAGTERLHPLFACKQRLHRCGDTDGPSLGRHRHVHRCRHHHPEQEGQHGAPRRRLAPAWRPPSYTSTIADAELASINLGAIKENTTSKTFSVTTLVKTDARASDPDKGATLGMALTGVTGMGLWQYHLAGGAWLNVRASVSATSALLLPNTALVRFVPTADQTGTASLELAGLGRTQGPAGQQNFAITATGGATGIEQHDGDGIADGQPGHRRRRRWHGSAAGRLRRRWCSASQ